MISTLTAHPDATTESKIFDDLKRFVAEHPGMKIWDVGSELSKTHDEFLVKECIWRALGSHWLKLSSDRRIWLND